jgi:multiple sugar transport system substrate-binding protein
MELVAVRKRLALVNIVVACAIVTAFAAITAGPVGAQVRHTGLVVNFASWSSNPTESASLSKTLKVFTKQTGVKVNYSVINGNYNAQLKTEMTAGTAPDVFYVNSDHARLFENLGELHSLNYLCKDKSFGCSKFYKNVQTGFVLHGTIYGFAKDWSPLVTFYNKTMFKKAHISSPPSTWSQFASDACKLHHKLSTKKHPVWGASLSFDMARLIPFIFDEGGAWLNKSQTKPEIDSKATVRALTQWRALFRSGCASDPSTEGASWNGDAFGRGVAAMTFEGNWLTSAMDETYPNISWGISQLPSLNGHRYNIQFTASYSMWKHTPHFKAATMLMKFLAGHAGEVVWTRNVGYIPSRSDVKPVHCLGGSGTGYKKECWNVQTYINEVKNCKTWFFPGSFIDIAYTPVNNDVQKYLQGKMSLSAALSDMQAQTTNGLRTAP